MYMCNKLNRATVYCSQFVDYCCVVSSGALLQCRTVDTVAGTLFFALKPHGTHGDAKRLLRVTEIQWWASSCCSSHQNPASHCLRLSRLRGEGRKSVQGYIFLLSFSCGQHSDFHPQACLQSLVCALSQRTLTSDCRQLHWQQLTLNNKIFTNKIFETADQVYSEKVGLFPQWLPYIRLRR